MTGAIITADIVNSTQLSKVEYKKLMKALGIILQPYQHEFFRGDSFQVCIKPSQEALRILLQLRASAIKASSGKNIADIKASIGIGKLRFPIKSLKTTSSEVFILSGRTFDQMQEKQRLIIITNEKNQAVNIGLKAISQFADYLFQRLTVKQAAVVLELLMSRTQTAAAKRLKRSQATVNKHTQSAGWLAIEELLEDYQKIVQLIEP